MIIISNTKFDLFEKKYVNKVFFIAEPISFGPTKLYLYKRGKFNFVVSSKTFEEGTLSYYKEVFRLTYKNLSAKRKRETEPILILSTSIYFFLFLFFAFTASFFIPSTFASEFFMAFFAISAIVFITVNIRQFNFYIKESIRAIKKRKGINKESIMNNSYFNLSPYDDYHIRHKI